MEGDQKSVEVSDNRFIYTVHLLQNDFMALLIENGYPVLVVDLGSGPERIISNKYVSDDIWRQVLIER